MRCNYPNCRDVAEYTPVIEVPTIRSKGVIPPTRPNPSVHAPDLQFSFQRYEELLAEAKLAEGQMVISQTPTMLIGREVCKMHKAKYNLFDWFKRSEWEVMREAARHHGCIIPESHLIQIKFMPVGWTPQGGLVIERNRMKPNPEY